VTGPWRNGRKLGRTLYIQNHPEVPDYLDTFVGMMETSELALEVCDAMNHWMACDCAEDCGSRLGRDVDEQREPDEGDQHPLDQLTHVTTSMDERGKVTAMHSVLEDDGRLAIVAVDGDGGVDGVPENGGAVAAPPTQADLPVVPLDPLGDSADTGHA